MNPILIPLALLLASSLVYLVRRLTHLATWISILICVALVYALWSWPFLSQSQALGRPILLDPIRQVVLSFMLLGSVAFFLFAGQISPGWSYFPFLLFSSGFQALAVMMESLLLEAIFLEIAGLVLVLLVPGGVEGRTRGALALLIALVVAGPLLFGASSLVEETALHPENLTLVRTTAAVLATGFGLLLAVLPLGFYLAGVAYDAPPLVTAFVTGIYQPMVFFVLWSVLGRYPGLGEQASVFLFWGGILASVLGGLLAYAQRTAAGLLAYGALADMGVALVGLGTASSEGAAVAMAHFLSRLLGLALITMGWGAIRYHWGSASAELPMAIGKLPWAAAGYFLGGLSLAGFPGTVGFITRWAVSSAVESSYPIWGLALWASGWAVALGYLRFLDRLWGEDPELPPWKGWVIPVSLLALVAVSLLLGIYPQGIFRLVEAAFVS